MIETAALLAPWAAQDWAGLQEDAATFAAGKAEPCRNPIALPTTRS